MINSPLPKSIEIALDSLSKDDQKKVHIAILQIENFQVSDLSNPRIQIFKTNSNKKIYVYRVDESLRLFFEINSNNEVELIDIVRKERLAVFGKKDLF
ncbi:MAG: hypothetical protein SFU25_00635 [Candidatus Caenarcaniphilales bacterium]|nr:hypothetical protein [Candidatus Caenarcaniphilales bacterium]